MSKFHLAGFWKQEKKFGWPYSLCTAFYGLFEDIFEILRVLAFCRTQKIQNRVKIDWATAKNVKFVKIGLGRFIKNHKNLIYWTAKAIFDKFYILGYKACLLTSRTAFRRLYGLFWPYNLVFFMTYSESLGSWLSGEPKIFKIGPYLTELRTKT